jgi:hypothetical protein
VVREIESNDRRRQRASARRAAAIVCGALVVAVFARGPVGAAEPNPTCADPNGDGQVTASDALEVLHTALALSDCDPCLCDVNGSGQILATDALAALQISVGLTFALACPPCPTTTTTTTSTTTTTLRPVFVACADPRTDAPACDGYCSVDGQMCVESPPFSGNCQCISNAIACGFAAGPPVCSGSCPKLQTCTFRGGRCECAF